MTERWERLAKALIPGAHTVWQSSWDERKLADLNDAAVYDRLTEGLRRLNEDIDLEMWEREF